MSQQKKTVKKKKDDKWLEAMLVEILQKSLKTALDQAMDDIFKGWN